MVIKKWFILRGIKKTTTSLVRANDEKNIAWIKYCKNYIIYHLECFDITCKRINNRKGNKVVIERHSCFTKGILIMGINV